MMWMLDTISAVSTSLRNYCGDKAINSEGIPNVLPPALENDGLPTMPELKCDTCFVL